MKTRLTVFTSVVFLLASFALSAPATAQRRTTNTTVVTKKSEQKSNSKDDRQKVVVKKEVKKEKVTTEDNSGRRTSATQKQTTTKTRSGSRTPAKQATKNNSRRVSQQPAEPAQKKSSVTQRRPANTGTATVRKNPAGNSRDNYRSNNNINKDQQVVNAPANPRARAEHNRTVYRVNPNENRYKPVKNFKGNNNNWSGKQASYHIHHSKREVDFYRNYDHRRYKHWDPAWQQYRWTVNSWRDYYSGYHPQSYRYHKHYFYHPAFGHVIKKFSYKPDSFVHNNVRYYNYNGHFFRRFKGVGYVLVDMPYGLVFKKLPVGYERVYINGYLYFRVGNLFFESNPHGYALIHYPERYYALDNDYYNGGYFRSVDFSIRF